VHEVGDVHGEALRQLLVRDPPLLGERARIDFAAVWSQPCRMRLAWWFARSRTRTESRYDAFISYSHEGDQRIAASLRSALHRFAKPWYMLRALRVFLDRASLSAAPDLWDDVRRQ